MSLLTRKPLFGVFDQVRLKLACAATEASYRLGILEIETRDIILSRQRITSKMLVIGYVWFYVAGNTYFWCEIKLFKREMRQKASLVTWEGKASVLWLQIALYGFNYVSP